MENQKSALPPPERKTPLFERHQALKAKIVPFSGYLMPVQYSGIIDEHLAVRQNAGLFDVSHMGVATVEGAGALSFLNSAVTRDLSTLAVGRAAYTLLCLENGGTVDDLIVYRESENKFFLVLNAGNKEADLAYLKKLQEPQTDFVIQALFEELCLLALQGPKSPQILQKLGFQAWPEAFSFVSATLSDFPVKLAFTGYTGEKGCEIFVKSSDAPALWDLILKTGLNDGVKACGLGARDTLRTEMGYSLYGHELSPSINPIEAGLGWAVGLKKEKFVGKSALVKAKDAPLRKLICLKNASKQAPRPEMPVFDDKGVKVGEITSGTFAPSLGYAIGMALVAASSQDPYSVELRGSKVPFEKTTRPFLKSSSLTGSSK